MLRKLWLIAFNNLVRTGRDRKALALLLLFPVILIGILGNALSEMMFDANSINPFPVVLVNADQPSAPPSPPTGPAVPAFHFGQMLVQDVLGSSEVTALVVITQMTDLEQARREVSEERAAAVIYVPPSFTADALAGKASSLQLIADPGRPTQVEIVSQILSGFTEGITSGMLAARHLGADRVKEIASLSGDKEPKLINRSPGTRPVSAMQYYAAAMSVMFMMMTALGQARVMIQERQDGTMDRVLVSPTNRAVLLSGQILGTMLLVLTQFLILAVGTRLLYGVYWGEWLAVLLLGATFALAAGGIAITTASIMNDAKAADAAVGVVGNIFAALSGAMLPLYAFPEGMKLIAKAIPNYWALQGFIDQMAGLGLTHLWLPILVLTGIGTVAGALGTWRLAAAR